MAEFSDDDIKAMVLRSEAEDPIKKAIELGRKAERRQLTTEIINFDEGLKAHLEILQDPKLFDKITETEMDKKIVGESDARKTIFLCAGGGRLIQNASLTSYNLLVSDETGVGKDYIVRSVLELLPEEFWVKKTRISEKVLTYWHCQKYEPNWTWDGKVFYVEDISQSTLNSEVFKVFSSSGSSAVVLVNQTPVEVVVIGKPVQLITSAKAIPNEENLRRFPIINLDSGVNQTKAIIKRRGEFAKKGVIPDYDKRFINAQRYLNRVKVKIDFADMLSTYFCSKLQPETIMRTHFDRFLDYIKASAGIHQYQRKTDSEGFVLAEEQDYEIGRIIFLKLTSNPRMIPLTKDNQRILDVIKNMPEDLEGYSVAELEEKITFLSDKWLREQLDFLTEHKFLKKGSKTAETNRKVQTYSYLPEGVIDIPTFPELQEFYKQYNSTNNTIATNTTNRDGEEARL